MKKHSTKLLLIGIIYIIAFTSCEKETEASTPVLTGKNSISQLSYASEQFYGPVKTVATSTLTASWNNVEDVLIPEGIIKSQIILEYDKKGILIKEESYSPTSNVATFDDLRIYERTTYDYDYKLRLSRKFEKTFYYTGSSSIPDYIDSDMTIFEYNDDDETATQYVYSTPNEEKTSYIAREKKVYKLRPDGHIGDEVTLYYPKRSQASFDDDFENKPYYKSELKIIDKDDRGNWTQGYSRYTNYYRNGSTTVDGWNYRVRTFTYH